MRTPLFQVMIDETGEFAQIEHTAGHDEGEVSLQFHCGVQLTCQTASPEDPDRHVKVAPIRLAENIGPDLRCSE